MITYLSIPAAVDLTSVKELDPKGDPLLWSFVLIVESYSSMQPAQILTAEFRREAVSRCDASAQLFRVPLVGVWNSAPEVEF